MHRRPSLSLASLLLVGLWVSACDNEPEPPANLAPILTGPTVQASDVTSGTAVALTLEATDPDEDSLTYAWVQAPTTPAGTFSDPSAASTTWTAPQVTTATSFQLGVEVSDGKDGGTVRRSVTVLVRPAPPANRAPVLAGGTPSASPASVTGAVPVRLSLSASDADGDPLTYSWTQEPAAPIGSFSSFSSSSPTWISPEVIATTRFTLKVTVSDGKGGTVQGQVEVNVAPPNHQNRAPVLTAGPSGTPTTLTSGQSVTLAVSASDADNDVLSYSWAQVPSTPAGTFSSNGTPNPSWTAPTVASSTNFQLSVTVSDGQGGLVSGSVNVTVQPPANQSPTITQGPGATPSSVTGSAPVQLSVTATDPNGDTPTYAWTQMPTSPAGTFSSTTTRNPTWTSPVVGSTQSFTLRVTVSDGKGGTAQGQVNVSVAPPLPTNRNPTLTGPTATPSTLNSQQLTNLSLTASDPDGDTPSYTWTQNPTSPAGIFSSTTTATPTWRAPTVATATQFQLRVAVSDGKGGTANGSATVTVNPIPNNSPVLTAGPTPSATTVDEQQSITLSATATDADGDLLTYAWDQTAPTSPKGSFTPPSATDPTWTAPNVNADGPYTLRVTVSDGQGGSVEGTVNITVRKVNQPPTVDANITGPASLIAGEPGTFSISASDPDGDTLTYSWDQTDPATQGSWLGSRTGSSAQWYSPVLATQTSFTLSVTVTDGQSTPVVRSITVPVSVPLYADIQSVWSVCTNCHGGSGGLSLSAANSYANLVGVTASNVNCNTLQRVTPGDPDSSVLIRKMEGATCGGRMPQNNTAYFDTNPGLIVRVRSWILAGALEN